MRPPNETTTQYFLTTFLALTGCNTYKASIKTNPNGNATPYNDSAEIPEGQRPNDATVSLYLERKERFLLRLIYNGEAYVISPKGNHEPFARNPNPPSESLIQELAEGYIYSYLYYDNGRLIYDGVADAGRYSKDINDETMFFTHSAGKSIVSYLIGHAICQGYISSIDEAVEWPMMSETLYQGQPLIDLLNMAAGDQHLVWDNSSRLVGMQKHHRNLGHDTIAHYLKGSEKSSNAVFYNNILTDILASFLAYKTGDDYDEFLREIFQEKVKIENKIVFQLHTKSLTESQPSPYYGQPQTRASYSFLLTRYDFMRIAVAIMNDYQAQNCVGQYLRQAQESAKRWYKYDPQRERRTYGAQNAAQLYGAQFYWKFDGLRGVNATLMSGKGQQNALIDFDNSRIVTIHSATDGYDVHHFLIKPVASGQVPK